MSPHEVPIMGLPGAFFRVVGRAILNALGGGVAGEVVVELLPEAARKVRDWWCKEATPEQRRAEIEAIAQAPVAEVRAAVAAAVAEAAGDQPKEVQVALSLYLSQVPAAIRASLRRPADPAGHTVPRLANFDEEDAILQLLPAHLPRFQPGDRPLPGIDWELVELLGAGGFGEVWKARNPHFDAVPPVALKFCLDPAAKDRLLRHEAAILNQVMRQGRHAGIVALQHTYLSADPPCLEYEFVSGGDLAAIVQEWQGLTPADRAAKAAALMLELARVVAFAHKLEPPIVHRDLKPANILVEPGEGGTLGLRVADFGIGGVAAGRAIARTARGVSQGDFLVTALRGAHTPLYASPQQMRGMPPDPRDDVYALGVIWYQLLTGSLVAGRPGGSRWTKRLAEQGVPEGQIDLLGSCVEEDPSDRPSDAGAIAENLQRLLAPSGGRKSAERVPDRAFASQREKSLPYIEVTEKCPDCDGPMKMRFNKAGGYFLGCAAYPRCRGTRRPPPELVERIMALADPVPSPASPGEGPARVVNSIGMRLAMLRAGTFRMGSPLVEESRGADEGPVRPVAITRPCYLGIYPVTQREFEEVMGSNPSFFHKGNGGRSDHPVEKVVWDEAVEFCRRLTARQDERAAGRRFRLPSEAEWEYACRAGTTTPFCFGETLSSFQANFDGARPYVTPDVGPFHSRTTKVGAYGPNAWGFFDMHGNVWEWCADWYAEDAYATGAASDPGGSISGTMRVVRGGSWMNSGHMCRSARRNKYAPDHRGENVGFRVAMELRADA